MEPGQSNSRDKLRGGYYTPTDVADWLADWAIRSKQDRILEPSCGDGVFVEAALNTLRRRRALLSQCSPQILGVELVSEEADKARLRATGFAKIVTADFFDWLDGANQASYDVVLGNPPFIRYQSFPEPSRTKAMTFMTAQGLTPNRLTNAWVPFVVAATALLRDAGRLAMVLPAELLQVSYAAQLRRYLVDSFRRITIFACNEIFFAGAQQEVVLLAAEGKLKAPNPKNRCSITLLEAPTLREMLASKPKASSEKTRKVVEHDTEKWLKYFLSASEIQLMRALRNHPSVGVLRQLASVDVGVVTGRNEFFVLEDGQVRLYHLQPYVVPLVGRSSHLPGAVFRERDLCQLRESGKYVHLLHLSASDQRKFTPELRALLRHGEALGYHRGYKCRIRDPWYEVPSVWEPDSFFFRQIYDFPRVVVNRTRATSTDTIHRMSCRTAPSRVAANLYTHLTAASAEIEGRSYGGGVLELEPTEAERLLVPRELNGAMAIDEVDRLVRGGRLADVLEENDRLILQNSLGLSRAQCRRLKTIWAKMRERRWARRRTQSRSTPLSSDSELPGISAPSARRASFCASDALSCGGIPS